MRRKYNAEMAMQAIELLRRNIPDVCFTTDVIVGFPQESEKDFEETVDFVKKANFLMVHIFPYSSRKGTEAAKMKGQISGEEKSRRLHLLEDVVMQSSTELLTHEINVQPIRRVLFENFDGEYAYGHTDNFIEVAVPSIEDLRGELRDVNLELTNGKLCFGKLINTETSRSENV
jgi:threonylcarbamoyladenosine tRNA methylthiotransferase MtaB